MRHARVAGSVVARLSLLATALVPVGCTQLEVERTLPDGSRQSYRFVAFKPSLEVRPDSFRISPWGRTDEGYPVDLLVPREGRGRTLYRVSPPGADPLYFESARQDKPVTLRELLDMHDSRVPDLSPRSSAMRCVRLRADLDQDVALLETSMDGEVWIPVAAGPVPAVAMQAAQHGLRRIDFENSHGPWSVAADSTFPLVTVWLDDQPVAVRPIG